ncbi:MAG TPA: hypothetical protein VK157_13780 [Phycisphaerales bacterium]|nr:hypothetical protein [Phycisphaerales bacterium]
MIVVADTGPINYLVLIDCVHVLPALFGSVRVPTAVIDELQHAAAPSPVRAWAAQPPEWLSIVASATLPGLAHLDAGEAAALSYAAAVAAQGEPTLVLMDEIKGRRAAERMGLAVRGTLGVLDLAGAQKLVRTTEALTRLQATSFHAQPHIMQAFLERARQREA